MMSKNITDIQIIGPLKKPAQDKTPVFKKEPLPKAETSPPKKPKKSKKKLILVISIIVFIIALASAAVFFLFFNKKGLEEVPQETKPPEKVEVSPFDTESPLNGVLTTKEKAQRRPIAVAIENHTDARPQSGLDKAGLVYEAVTEGGITRFLAFFVENDISEIGPIRSARTCFVRSADEYNAFYAHVGDNKDALALIKELDNFFDIDQFSLGKYYWRDKKRYAPHNVYSSTDNLRKAGESKKWNANAEYDKWLFKDDERNENRGQTKKITINFSSANYKVDYYYDREFNIYKRNLAGKEHVDKNTEEQIKAKTVIIQYVQSWLKPPENPKEGQSTEIKNDGTGKAVIFIDGKKITGTWKKLSRKQRTKFYDESGNEVKFNRGQIWIELASSGVGISDE